MKNTRHVSLSAALLLAVGGAAVAQTPGIDRNNVVGYVIDQRDNVARSGAGLCWRTGFWTPQLAIRECDPDLVPAAAPAVAPAKPAAAAAAPVATPAPAPKKCDFSIALGSDETFKFNKADLTPAAKSRLDNEFMAKLGACASVASIEVVGHTDRLGAETYNQGLSARRAAAVAGYLSGKGVKGITSAGVGESQPLADVTCSDKLPRAKLIACLAPNRRVVIDVKGMAK